jgi:hypothetical protein
VTYNLYQQLDKSDRARRAHRGSSSSVSDIYLPLIDSASDSISESSLGELEPFDDLPSDSAAEGSPGDLQLQERANDSVSDSSSSSSLSQVEGYLGRGREKCVQLLEISNQATERTSRSASKESCKIYKITQGN